jgi:hypothetical protein
MSPISATKVMAVIGPIPGSDCSAWTRGSGLALATRSRSSRATGGLIASIGAGQSVTIARCTAGRASSARKTRPPDPTTTPGHGGVVGQVAVGELDAMVVHQRHVGALAVDVPADLHPHQGLLPLRGLSSPIGLPAGPCSWPNPLTSNTSASATSSAGTSSTTPSWAPRSDAAWPPANSSPTTWSRPWSTGA